MALNFQPAAIKQAQSQGFKTQATVYCFFYFSSVISIIYIYDFHHGWSAVKKEPEWTWRLSTTKYKQTKKPNRFFKIMIRS